MRLITKNDASLAVGLIAATIIAFQHPLNYVLTFVQEVQNRYHLDLLPALTLLVIVFMFHEYRKRQDVKSYSLATAAEAARVRSHSAELERLMALSQAVGNALEPAALQRVLWQHLPALARDREFWMLIRKEDRWEPLVLPETMKDSAMVETLEAAATRTLSTPFFEGGGDGLVDGADVCFPAVAAGAAVGVFAVRNTPPLAAEERKAIAAAAAVVAIGVRNVQLFLETRELSLRDSLTGCFNRGFAVENLGSELRRARRVKHPTSVIMFDIDHFKSINDQLGHLRGDELLRSVGTTLTRITRSSDVRCRYGGDEFLVILPDTPQAGAEQVAECIRREIASLNIPGVSDRMSITASLGVAVVAPGDADVTEVIERADAALYQAKRGGRNRFAVSTVGLAAAGPAKVLSLPPPIALAR